jgi:Holliday junction resolvasome RuvABC ATP-dependent DNA helicase subunit
LDAHLQALFDTIVGEGAETMPMQVMAESCIVQREMPFLLKFVHDFVKPINRKTFKDVMLREATGLMRVQILRKKFDVLCRSRGWKNGQKFAARRNNLDELVSAAFPNHGLDAGRIKAAVSTDWIDGDEFVMLAADVMEYLQFRLSEVVGLTALKSSLTAFCRGVVLDKRRSEIAAREGTDFIPSKPRHMIFRGNPGTGKTTIARIVGDILWKAGLVTTRAFVYVQREDLVGSAVGKTAQLTKGKIEEAQGGILFVDEAYRLFPKESDGKDFGREAVEELMAAMLVDDGPLMIFAGYPKQMDVFVHSNPGLRSRIPNSFEFDNFTWLEMALILDQLVKKSGLRWADGVSLSRTRAILKQATPAGALESMNGRLCELVLMFAKQNLDQRLAGFSDGDETDQLFELTLDDIRYGCAVVPRSSDPRISHCVVDEPSQCLEDIQDSKEWLQARLSKMVGLEDLKEQIYLFYRSIAMDGERAKQGHKVLRSHCNHMAFVGNPGTGKTSVARIMAELLQRCGLIESQKLVEVQREAFLGSGVVGSTEATTEEIIGSARGGVLFVDEAPRLSEDEAGRQVIQVIMSHMLERNAPVVIFAGPRAPMAGFLRTDPGLASRIPYTFTFPDYAPPALAHIFRADVKKMGFDLSVDVTDEALSSVFVKCGIDVRTRTNGRLCQLAFKFAKEALDADCGKHGTISWEFKLEHVASGVSRAEKMQAHVLGKFIEVDSSHQQKLPAHRVDTEFDTFPAVPAENSDVNNRTLPKDSNDLGDGGIQVKEFTTETKKWMQTKPSDSELLARIRSLDALMESAVKTLA